MKEIAKKGRIAVACALALTAAFSWQIPCVHAQLNTKNLRWLDRGLLWTGFRNQGTQGGVLGRYDSRSAPRMAYPGMGGGAILNLAGPDYLEYWGMKPGMGYLEHKYEGQNLSGGEGVWVLTKVGDTYGVSYTGPFNPTNDIRPMYYDIANSPEKDMGYPVKVPPHGTAPGLTTGNWYPGAPMPVDKPDSGQPFEVLNHRFGKYMEPGRDSAAEDIILSQWTTKNGVTITRKAMAWSYQGFHDFFIVDLTFTNTGDSDGDGKPDVNGGAGYTLNDTYFSFMNAFIVSQAGKAWRYHSEGLPGDRGGEVNNDNVYRYTDAPNYDGPAANKGLKLNYQRDGDSPLSFDEDTGDPLIKDIQLSGSANMPGGRMEGQLMAYQYVGMAPLAYRDAGASHVFASGDRGLYLNPPGEQPFSSRQWTMRSIQNVQTDAPSVTTHSEKGMYEELTKSTNDNPAAVGAFVNAQTYGPYNLKVGDKAKVVLVYAAGSGADAIPRPGLPEYGVDPETFAHTDIPLSETERKARLAKGEQALVDHVKAAKFAYDNAYDLPDYPPDVEFSVGSNSDAQNQLTWSDGIESAVNPDYTGAEAQDIAGYRVFRSTWQEFGPWTLVGTVPKGASGANWTYGAGAYTWKDPTSAAGFRYFYNVRAYARPHAAWTNGTSVMANLPAAVQKHFKAGLEGGYASPLQKDNQVTSPFMPRTPEGDQMAKQIRVVPNPFSLTKEGANYQNTLKIRFVGIPTKCKITLFNFAGEIVGEAINDNPSAGEKEWVQRTIHFSSPEVATGIYFYVVESLLPQSMGKKARGTFAIIR